MKTPIYLLLIVCIFASCNTKQTQAEIDYTSYVNPFIGTDFTGNTYPGAQAPFGMVQLSPDNGLPGWDRISGYFYPDSTIAGFSHTHLSGTGAGDLYDISFMPVTLPYKEAEAPLGIYSKFSHDDESAYAGYYQVRLKDYNINVELTATERCGIQRYTFPKAEAAILLNLKKAMNWDFTNDSHIEVVDSVTIQGYRYSDGWARDQRIYFRTRFSKPFDKFALDTTAIIKENKRIGTATIARFDFKTEEGEQILVNTAISGVSMEGAAKNLQAEVPENDFDKYLAETKANWNRQLGKITVKGDNENDKVNFYTALYHSMIAPTIYSDVDGAYYGPDKKVHQSDGWVNYSTFSLWDTYRAAHPLYTILAPERVDDMIQSMLAHHKVQGYLPIWTLWGKESHCMIGNHAIPVIVDAYLKGLITSDPERAYAAIKESLTLSQLNSDWEVYDKYGYYPFDIIEKESVSRTLESAYDDYCAALMAQALGKEEDYRFFMKRAGYYQNLFDKQTGMMRGKDSTGSWRVPFNMFSLSHASSHGGDYTEGNAWQYTWHVQHDVEGLISLMGGKQAFSTKLDSLFYLRSENAVNVLDVTGLIGQYAHGNEPSHHVAYLYTYVDKAYKTQELIREIFDRFYLPEPSGLCGNDDCGQMSAWYIFSAMGFYPVNPVGGEYIIGAPQLKRIVLHLPENKTFTVEAVNLSKQNKYVKAVALNGQEITDFRIQHKDILAGGHLIFTMSDKPGN